MRESGDRIKRIGGRGRHSCGLEALRLRSTAASTSSVYSSSTGSTHPVMDYEDDPGWRFLRMSREQQIQVSIHIECAQVRS